MCKRMEEREITTKEIINNKIELGQKFTSRQNKMMRVIFMIEKAEFFQGTNVTV